MSQYNPSDEEVATATEYTIAAMVEVIRTCEEFHLDLEIITDEAKRLVRLMDHSDGPDLDGMGNPLDGGPLS